MNHPAGEMRYISYEEYLGMRNDVIANLGDLPLYDVSTTGLLAAKYLGESIRQVLNIAWYRVDPQKTRKANINGKDD